MSSLRRDAATVRIPPPLIFGLAISIGILLQRVTLALPIGLPETLRIAGTIGATVFGVGLILIALALFQRSGQDPTPWTSTPAVVAKGVYKLSRNPMYLGMALLQGAVGLGRSNGWVLLLLPPTLLFIHWSAIRHEEAYLEDKFGERYRRYKASVRRWI